MSSDSHRVLGWVISTVLGIASYTVLFLFLLGMKFLQRAADTDVTETWVVGELIVATVLLVITVTAVVLIFFNRTLSGRFFFITIILGIILLLFGSLMLLVAPVKAALGLGKYTWVGLLVGNSIVALSNVASFFFRIPSLL